MEVVREGQQIGVTTSGTFSPTLKQGIALARVNSEVAVGDHVDIVVRGRPVPAEVTKLPFVPSRVRA
jgi:aminomethyltransferase